MSSISTLYSGAKDKHRLWKIASAITANGFVSDITNDAGGTEEYGVQPVKLQRTPHVHTPGIDDCVDITAAGLLMVEYAEAHYALYDALVPVLIAAGESVTLSTGDHTVGEVPAIAATVGGAGAVDAEDVLSRESGNDILTNLRDIQATTFIAMNKVNDIAGRRKTPHVGNGTSLYPQGPDQGLNGVTDGAVEPTEDAMSKAHMEAQLSILRDNLTILASEVGGLMLALVDDAEAIGT